MPDTGRAAEPTAHQAALLAFLEEVWMRSQVWEPAVYLHLEGAL